MLTKLSEISSKLTKVLQFLGLLMTIVVSIFVSVNKAIDTKLADSERRMYDLVLSKTTPLEDYVYSQIILSVNKKYHLLRTDPKVLRDSNVEMVIKNWQKVPDNYKTDDIRLKYDMLLKWYANR